MVLFIGGRTAGRYTKHSKSDIRWLIRIDQKRWNFEDKYTNRNSTP